MPPLDKLFVVLMAAILLSGCAMLSPLIGGVIGASTSIPGAIVLGAGTAAGEFGTKIELEYLRAVRRCNRANKTQGSRQICINRWRVQHLQAG
jgi:hypothetical protein